MRYPHHTGTATASAKRHHDGLDAIQDSACRGDQLADGNEVLASVGRFLTRIERKAEVPVSQIFQVRQSRDEDVGNDDGFGQKFGSSQHNDSPGFHSAQGEVFRSLRTSASHNSPLFAYATADGVRIVNSHSKAA